VEANPKRTGGVLPKAQNPGAKVVVNKLALMGRWPGFARHPQIPLPLLTSDYSLYFAYRLSPESAAWTRNGDCAAAFVTIFVRHSSACPGKD
jgi:hypothetical protein